MIITESEISRVILCNYLDFQYFKVLQNLSLRTNQLGDMEVLSEPFGGMERLKTMDLRNNPLSTMPKYRDYVVILCKSLGKIFFNLRIIRQQENSTKRARVLSQTLFLETC